MIRGNDLGRGRLILLSLLLVLGAFWIGARYGPRQAQKVEARRLGENPKPVATAPPQHATALTEEEAINVRLYRQASPAVARRRHG